MAVEDGTIEAPQVQAPPVEAPAAPPTDVQAPAGSPSDPPLPSMRQREEGGFDGRTANAPATPPAVPETPPTEAPAAPGGNVDSTATPAAPASPPAANTPPSEGGDDQGGFSIPDSLSTLFKDDKATDPEKPVAEPSVKYANDEARVVGEYLSSGGSMEDVRVYQQADTYKAMSDYDIVINAYQKENPTFSKEAITAHLERKFGGNLTEKAGKDAEGNPTTAPVDQAAMFGLSQEAKQFRQEIDATVAKVAAAVNPAEVPAQAAEQKPEVTDPSEGSSVAAADAQLALRAARDVLDQNQELSIVAVHDGIESTVKVKLSDEQRRAIEGPLAATVAQLKNSPQFQKIDHTNATQFKQAVQTATERLAFAFNYDQIVKDIFADGVSKGRKSEVQRAAGVTGQNIYNRGGSAPTGSKNGKRTEFDKWRMDDAIS